MRKHLRNSVFVIAIFHTLFFGCDKQPEKKNYIARVNDSYLTKEELSNLDSLFKGSFSRAELIDKWVDKELLFQQAEKLGITEDEEFLSVINNSR
ncbi:MAG: hypothetical protein HXY50_01815, partial [Ignavibacteriaceae bacterium]|nr:hypothetical protein [Ignavibacteriaceae bacterium]